MKRVLSGIQPSGSLTLGNYLGAIKQFVKLQNEMEDTEFFIFIADLHAITVPQDPTSLRKNIRSLAAIYLACGLNPEKVNLFIQSEVENHSKMGHIMECITYIGELERMTQYKDKMVKQVNGVSSALLTYPTLMAGDILLYNADYVPVGVDQKQHLELTRTLAERFNNRYSETFKVPEPLIVKEGAKIMSLQEPTKKMSKSDTNLKASVFLLDTKEQIEKKILSAVTDSDMSIKFDMENKPGVSNLINIYSSITGKTVKEIEELYKDSNYGEFKKAVANVVVDELVPIQAKYNYFINSKELDDILTNGAINAQKASTKVMNKVYHKMGLGRY